MKRYISASSMKLPAGFKERSLRWIKDNFDLDFLEAEKKGYVDANRVDTAIELIQEINDSKITPKEELEEREKHLFDYSDITDRIVNNLSNQMFDRVFDSDDFISAEERIKKADIARKHKEILDARKAESRRLLSYEAEAIDKLIKDAKWEDEAPMAYKDTEEIKSIITDTVDILYCMKPKINIKAAE